MCSDHLFSLYTGPLKAGTANISTWQKSEHHSTTPSSQPHHPMKLLRKELRSKGCLHPQRRNLLGFTSVCPPHASAAKDGSMECGPFFSIFWLSQAQGEKLSSYYYSWRRNMCIYISSRRICVCIYTHTYIHTETQPSCTTHQVINLDPKQLEGHPNTHGTVGQPQ